MLLTYRHPLVAAVVIGAILIGLAMVLPLLLRVLSSLLRGVSGRVTSWFSAPTASVAIPEWLAPDLRSLQDSVNSQAVPCFARKIPNAPRMKRGYLVFTDRNVYFAHQGVCKAKLRQLDGTGLALTRGLIFDVAGPEQDTGKWSVYLTKDCTAPSYPAVVQASR